MITAKRMIVYKYDENYCDIDNKPCIRGSKPECPAERNGIVDYCQHFHVKDSMIGKKE